MSVAADIQAPVNGLLPRPTEVNEALEYQKILSIYNQVKAGTHPRLKLSGAARPQPQKPIVQPSPFPGKVAPVVSAAAPKVSQATPTNQPSGVRFDLGAQEQPARSAPLNDSGVPSQPVPSKAPMSELDPIFLTKSDGLVRAELQLQRQRAERVLREQLEQKRADARHKPSCAEAKPEFDVADVLTKALALVKPVVFEKSRGANETTTASNSLDENSFYSSKAPDSATSEEDDLHLSSMFKDQVQPVEKSGRAADGLVDRRPGELQQVDLTGSPYRVLPPPIVSIASDHHPHRDLGHRKGEASTLAPIAIDEDDDEPEYSPPEPTQSFSNANGNAGFRDNFPPRGRRASGRHANQWHNTRRHESPVDTDVRIVRSHITSPVAPQPSRVSPLALAKGPPLSQNLRNRQDLVQERRTAMVDSERTSPDIAMSATQPRKRRKLQNGKRPARTREIDSPDPVIKDEPVSPPPFHNVPPLGAVRHRHAADRPTYIDLEAARDVHLTSERRPRHSPIQIISDLEGQAPHSVPRVLSRAGPRDVSRSNQDPRRVMSLQDLPARDHAETTHQTPTRVSQAPFYAVDEGIGRPRLLEQPPRLPERSHVPHQSPVPSPAYREMGFDRGYERQSMSLAHQRRIVVDEYGQRFYESVPPPRALVGHADNRRQELEGYNERAATRNGLGRSGSVFEEPRREARYVQEMPPPQVLYRRISDAPKPATSDIRYVEDTSRPAAAEYRYATRESLEPRHSPRSGSVQMLDYPVRQPVYLDENLPPREAAVRVAGVRPAVRAYEEPREMLQRVPSVRPEGREWSVFPEEVSRGRREPVQVERPIYEVRRTAEGDAYYRIDDGGRMVMERPMDARASYAPRYTER